MCFCPVTTDSLEERLGIKLMPHPDKVAEAAALTSLQPPPLRYHLALPKQILLREKHSLSFELMQWRQVSNRECGCRTLLG